MKMNIKITLEKEDFGPLHDVIFGSIGIKPTNDQIQEIWDNLPNHIKGTAVQWGTNDSVFRDNMYDYLIKNIKQFEEYLLKK
jgi:hypothetical protein